VTGYDQDIQIAEYDDMMDMMSVDMKFDREALEVVGDSFIEMQILKEKPDMNKLFTEKFLPTVK
jgi:hypothetical protein